MDSMAKHLRTQGISLVELIVAMTIGSLLILGAAKFISVQSRSSQTDTSVQGATSDLDDLTKALKADFARRVTPNYATPFTTTASTGFTGTLCNDFQIQQHSSADPNALETVTYQTLCTQISSDLGGGPAVHPQTACPSFQSQVVITRTDAAGNILSTVTYPKRMDLRGTSLCFRTSATTVEAEAGTLYSSNPVHLFSVRIPLDPNDKNSSIELMPN